MDDMLVTNACIVDGTGRAASMGDVAVNGGRIAEVGRLAGARPSGSSMPMA